MICGSFNVKPKGCTEEFYLKNGQLDSLQSGYLFIWISAFFILMIVGMRLYVKNDKSENQLINKKKERKDKKEN